MLKHKSKHQILPCPQACKRNPENQPRPGMPVEPGLCGFCSCQGAGADNTNHKGQPLDDPWHSEKILPCQVQMPQCGTTEQVSEMSPSIPRQMLNVVDRLAWFNTLMDHSAVIGCWSSQLQLLDLCEVEHHASRGREVQLWIGIWTTAGNKKCHEMPMDCVGSNVIWNVFPRCSMPWHLPGTCQIRRPGLWIIELFFLPIVWSQVEYGDLQFIERLGKGEFGEAQKLNRWS